MKCPRCHSEQIKTIDNNAPTELKTGELRFNWDDATLSVTIAGEFYTHVFRRHTSGLLFRLRWYKFCDDCKFQWDQYHEMS